MHVAEVNSQPQESSRFCDEQIGSQQRLRSLQATFQCCVMLSIIAKDEQTVSFPWCIVVVLDDVVRAILLFRYKRADPRLACLWAKHFETPASTLVVPRSAA